MGLDFTLTHTDSPPKTHRPHFPALFTLLTRSQVIFGPSNCTVPRGFALDAPCETHLPQAMAWASRVGILSRRLGGCVTWTVQEDGATELRCERFGGSGKGCERSVWVVDGSRYF